MQVKTKQQIQVFKPVTLEITFDTSEELKVFHDMLNLDLSIPNLVYAGDKRTQRVMTGVMQTIGNAIDDAKMRA